MKTKILKTICLLLPVLLAVSTTTARAVEDGQIDDNSLHVNCRSVWVRNRDVMGLEAAKVRSHQYLLTVDYPATSRITLHGETGAASMRLHRSEGETISFGSRIAYGAGLNLQLYRSTDPVSPSIELSTRYFTFTPDEGEVSGVSNISRYKEPHKKEIDWTQWQVSMTVTKPLPSYTLYGGATYSVLECDFKRTWPSGSVEKETFQQEEEFGLFTGIRAVSLENFLTSLEINFLNETTYTFAIGYRF